MEKILNQILSKITNIEDSLTKIEANVAERKADVTQRKTGAAVLKNDVAEMKPKVKLFAFHRKTSGVIYGFLPCLTSVWFTNLKWGRSSIKLQRLKVFYQMWQ